MCDADAVVAERQEGTGATSWASGWVQMGGCNGGLRARICRRRRRGHPSVFAPLQVEPAPGDPGGSSRGIEEVHEALEVTVGALIGCGPALG